MEQENVSKIIKQIREKHKLTQSQFANKLGVTFQAVSKWENEKNIPDITILNKISKEFDIDINEILNGTKAVKNNNKNKLIFLFIGLILLLIVVAITFWPNDKLVLKPISTNASEFSVSGSIVYNNDVATIYVSDIEYAGENKDKIYKSINFTLYEEYGDKLVKISERIIENGNQNSFEEIISDIHFNVENYAATCKQYACNAFYIKVTAKDNNDQISTFEIPFVFLDDCTCE